MWQALKNISVFKLIIMKGNALKSIKSLRKIRNNNNILNNFRVQENTLYIILMNTWLLVIKTQHANLLYLEKLML